MDDAIITIYCSGEEILKTMHYRDDPQEELSTFLRGSSKEASTRHSPILLQSTV